MKGKHLQVNHLFEPLGIDKMPEFFWYCDGGTKQTAYQIIVRRNDEVIWNSNKVLSNKMNNIPYEGDTLHSRDLLTWELTLWDENDEPGETVSSSFEMGLLEESDFKARWIKGDYKADKKKRYPVDCFRKEFELNETGKARLYASARGIYDLFINGQRIEDFILAPGITDYRKRIQYQTYDVTECLNTCKNVLEIRLADGWYRGSSAAYGVVNVYGTETSVLAQLEIDGKPVVCTDKTFSWSNDGPLEFADLKDGEIVNANKIPSYSGKAKETSAKVNLVSSNNVHVREKEHFRASLVKKEPGKHVFDFGQNIAGYVGFRVKARKNERLEITCAEVLDGNKDIDMRGIQLPRPAKGWNQLTLVTTLLGNPPKKNIVMTPLQKIIFTCKEGVNEYKTSFAVFGFRYIEVISDCPVRAEDFEAIAVYSDMEETGQFSCDNELINKLVSNVSWSMKSNFLDIPTDCPTRERLGWTGDAQIFFNSASYLMDVTSFFDKWLIDMADAQYKEGYIPAVFPYEGVEMMYKSTGTSVGWADAVYLIPYRYYLKYNDISVLKENWPMIEKYLNYLFNNLGFKDKKIAKEHPDWNEFVYEKGVHLGEWLEPEEFRDKVYGTKAVHPEECTAYLCYSMNVIGKIAELLGKKELAEKCHELEQNSRRVYNEMFVSAGTINTNRQAKLVRPLALGLLENEIKTNVQKQLKKAVEEYDFCVGTGFLSTPFILPVLEEAGFNDTAYKMLLNEKAPGWLSEVVRGATTVWENWEGDLSQNHYSPGAVVEWLFSSVGGIRIDADNHITIKPVFSDLINNVSCCYRSIYGNIETAWERNNGKYVLHVTVPSNVTAEIVLPEGSRTIEAGKYDFIF